MGRMSGTNGSEVNEVSVTDPMGVNGCEMDEWRAMSECNERMERNEPKGAMNEWSERRRA